MYVPQCHPFRGRPEHAVIGTAVCDDNEPNIKEAGLVDTSGVKMPNGFPEMMLADCVKHHGVVTFTCASNDLPGVGVPSNTGGGGVRGNVTGMTGVLSFSGTR